MKLTTLLICLVLGAMVALHALPALTIVLNRKRTKDMRRLNYYERAYLALLAIAIFFVVGVYFLEVSTPSPP